MARPTYKIDTQLLKHLRTSKGSSQQDVGIWLRTGTRDSKCQGEPDEDLVHSMTTAYQKIERTGNTSRRTAQLLAEYFNISPEELKAERPIDPFVRLHKQLTKLLENGGNESLNALYKECSTVRFSNISADDIEFENCDSSTAYRKDTLHDKITKTITKNILNKIDVVQWTGNPDDLNELIKITEMSERELLSIGYATGHWMILSHGADKSIDENSLSTIDSFPVVINIASGMESLAGHILQFFKEWENSKIARFLGNRNVSSIQEEKTEAKVTRKNNWYQIVINYLPDNNLINKIEFTHCEREGKSNIRWVDPFKSDRVFIKKYITSLVGENIKTIDNHKEFLSKLDEVFR